MDRGMDGCTCMFCMCRGIDRMMDEWIERWVNG